MANMGAGLGYGFGWQVLGSFACAGLTASVMGPVMLPQYVRRYYQRYSLKDDKPICVDDHSLMIVDKVLQRLKMPSDKENRIDFYVSHDFTPRYSGAFSHRGHCLIGLPINFMWNTEEDIERDKSEVFNKKFPWGYTTSDVIKENLVLTEKEKEFLVARQIGYVDSRHTWVTLAQKMLCIGIAYYAGHLTNYKMGFFTQRSRMKKAGVYQGLVFMGYGLAGIMFYLFMHDAYMCSLDKYADNYAATLGLDYAKAGASLYNKMVQINIAVRSLSMKNEKLYTANGNIHSGVLRTKTIPLVSRREQMRRLAAKLESKET